MRLSLMSITSFTEGIIAGPAAAAKSHVVHMLDAELDSAAVA